MNENQIPHWIEGRLTQGAGVRRAPVSNPATGQIVGEVALAAQSDVEDAVRAARTALPAWSSMSLARRTRILFRFRDLLDERKGELAEIITREHGKVLDDALGEVARGQETVEFACGISHLLKGSFSSNASTNVDIHSVREAIGVTAIISPFNFPAMVPMWFFPVAIAAGNTVILKPSEKDPSAALWMAALWKEAGLPDGVFNVLQGDKLAVDGLITHEQVNSVSFVGSTPIARYVYETASTHGKRVQALGGAKNHMIVLPDADLDYTAEQAINAGFGSAGERCMAISVIVAVGAVADPLVAKIAARARDVRVGDGTRACDMGPLVTREHRDRVASYIDRGVDEGATLVVDGRDVDPDGDAGGYWLGPTLFDDVGTEMEIYRDEIFGPVLAVIRVPDLDAAMDVLRTHPYGNGGAVFTSSGEVARRFANEAEIGMIGVNVPIPVPVAYYSFGGWKQSLFGDTHAHGPEGVHFFTRQKVVTTRWPVETASRLALSFPQNQ